VVLVSFVLVVVAAITLVIGLLQSGLGIIYVSIACSVLAGIVLFTAVLRGRPESRGASAPASRPAPQAAPPPAEAPAPAQEWSAPTPTPAPSSPPPERQPAMAAAPAGVAVDERDDRTETLDRVEIDDAVGADGDFPIHGYDSLRATEVLPILAELSDSQLEEVEERERNGKNRAMILNRIEAQKKTRASTAWEADDEGWSPDTDTDVGAETEVDGDEEPVAEPVGAPLFTGLSQPAASGEFPIPDFDELKALEVLGRLPDLSVAELQMVRRREEDGFRRAMVLNRIDRLIEEAPAEEPVVVVAPRRRASSGAAKAASRATRAPAPTRAPAAKRAPRKIPARASGMPVAMPAAAPAKRAARAAPAKRAAKAAPATRAAKAAPAKRVAKAPAGNAVPAKRAAATKSPAVKSAAPVRKATKKR